MSLVRPCRSLWQARWPMVSAMDSGSSGLGLNHETIMAEITVFWSEARQFAFTVYQPDT